MQKQSLLYMLLILTMSNSLYASWTFQGGGRVINEEQHLSPGTIGGGFLDKPVTLDVPKSLSVSASAIALSTSGAVNSTFNVFGQHSISIRNPTAIVQRYKYAYELCADKSKCMYYSGNIELKPGAQGVNQAASYVTVQFSQVGMYYSQAKTQISGEQNALRTDQGYISVFKG